MQATQALADACSKDLQAIDGRVHAPLTGQTVDVSPGSSSFHVVGNSFHVRLSTQIQFAVAWERHGLPLRSIKF
jgi:hypothetical protein